MPTHPSSDTALPGAVTAAWEARWAGSQPLGHLLRFDHGDRWIRFHSLPRSKRYADSDEEYATLLGRQHTVLRDLDAPDELVAITCSWTSGTDVPADREPELVAVAPATYWRTVLPADERDEPPADRVHIHLYVGSHPNTPEALDPLLLLAADDETRDVILAPPDFRWLLHPYDGGVDVIARDTEERDALRARHVDWLSTHPSGC